MEIDTLAGVGRWIKLGGKEYALTPLTIGDYGEISAYAKSVRLRILEYANPDMEIKDKIEAISIAPSETEINGALSDITGLIFQAWLHLRTNHPELTMQAVTRLITADNYKAVKDTIALVQGEQKNAQGQTADTK